MTENKKSGGVSIGNVGRDIKDSMIVGGDAKDVSMIVGRDLKDVTITLGCQSTPADKEPTFDELKQLLTEIQQEIADVTMTQQEALKKVSPATPSLVQGAEASVKDAAAKIDMEMKPQDAKSAEQSLTEATRLLSSILDGAKTIAKKTGEVASAVQPLAEKLAPLVEKVAVASFWVAKLWL